MANYREIAFDIDFTKKEAYNNQDIILEELTQNDHNSSVLALRLLQNEKPMDLTGATVVLNFLLPDGSDYKVDVAESHNISTRTSIVTYSIPQELLSQVGVVIGTVSLHKTGYRYTSIVQFKFKVVRDILAEGGIVDSEKYPILTMMISDMSVIQEEEAKRVEVENARVNAELERVELEASRETAEATRVLSELERQEAEESRMIAEINRELVEAERQKAEALRVASVSEMEASELLREGSETTRQESELVRIESEGIRVQSETVRLENEVVRESNELVRIESEELRKTAEIAREQKQNEFNTRAEEVAVRIEEEAQRIDGLVNVEESKLVKPNDTIDYMGKQHTSLKSKADSDVEYAIKTAVGEFNYLDYEGQHITAENSIEGRAKSAILKGCTLVNLAPITDKSVTSTGTSVAINGEITDLFEPNTEYTIIYNIEMSNYSSGTLNTLDTGAFDKIILLNASEIKNGNLKIVAKLTTLNNITSKRHGIKFAGGVGTLKIINSIVIKGDYTNIDIPYFEGMSSVKMPVLTTTGKNLLSKNNLIIEPSSVYGYTKFTNKVGNYILSITGLDTSVDISKIYFGFTGNGVNANDGANWVVDNGIINNNKLITTDKLTYFSFYPKTQETIDKIFKRFNIQIEQGTVATPYEPHKSNILTCLEPVELGGIGDVQDTLNVLTGEVVESVGKFVFDGSDDETWRYSNIGDGQSFKRFIIDVSNINGNQQGTDLICDKFTSKSHNIYNSETEGIHSKNSVIHVNINVGKLSENSIIGFKQWLSQNPISVNHVVAEKVHKTVVLKSVDQDGNEAIYENGVPVYSYDEVTHYSCGSEEGSVVPTASLNIPTNIPAVIASQRATINEQNAQITTLEEENSILTKQNEIQDIDISLNQEAINFMLFESMGIEMMNIKTKSEGVNTMSAYFANQILKGKLTYSQVVGKYPQFKEDIDFILVAEGRSDLIVE